MDVSPHRTIVPAAEYTPNNGCVHDDEEEGNTHCFKHGKDKIKLLILLLQITRIDFVMSLCSTG